jgi:hypothetical protein
MSPKFYRDSRRNIPASLEEWLDKWEPKLTIFKKNNGKKVSRRALEALDELEFLLARTVENTVAE